LFLLPEWDDSKGALKNLPEFNLALSGTFAPGSTFKIITSAALLEEGKIDPAEKVYCPGQFTLGNRTSKCWIKKTHKEGHKNQDFLSGLANSCDVYFWVMGLRAGGDLIEKYEKLFHIGEKTHIALSGEKPGGRFGPESRAARHKGWYDGDTLNLSIGQGELLVTPIQMAVMVAAVANRGTLWRPHFLRSIEYSDGRPAYEQKPESMGTIEFQPRTWELLDKALTQVIEAGTGVGVRIPGLKIAGKTGTAQNPHGDDHAWFVAYAGRPDEPPSLAVSVLVQQGGHGGSAAGPIARKAIEAAFFPEGALAKKPPPARKPAEAEAPQFPMVDE
jgi:penicillin-binding protein 2